MIPSLWEKSHFSLLRPFKRVLYRLNEKWASMNFVMKADFRTVKVKDQPIPSLLGWGRRIPGPLGAWVLNNCSLTGTWALPVGDLRQGSFKLGRSSGLQSCLGSSSSRMQVMDAGIWAAQAVGHSSGPGSYRAWATEVRSTGMGARAATGLAGSKDLRRRRHGFAESIQFSVSGSWPFASGDRERRGRLSRPEFQKQQVLPA